MKVFISWSGKLSHTVAVLFAQWLPSVIQECSDPFISSDASKGDPWFETITTNLKDNELGVVLITSENMNSSWLNFEAGALLNKFDKSGVRPLLVDIDKSTYKGPMSGLQLTEMRDRADMLLLMKSINARCSKPLSDKLLDKAFSNAWDELYDGLKRARSQSPGEEPPGRSPEDKIDEILDLVRSIAGDGRNIRNTRHHSNLRSEPLEYFAEKYGSLTASHQRAKKMGEVFDFDEDTNGTLRSVLVKTTGGNFEQWMAGEFDIAPF